jgi:hypothetical protein
VTAVISPSKPATAIAPYLADTEAVRLELIQIHRRAGHLIAELSTAPAWIEADRIAIRLIAEARSVAGTAARFDESDIPAVVRCRELGAAQRRLVGALRGDERLHIDATAVIRARALLAELSELCATLRR